MVLAGAAASSLRQFGAGDGSPSRAGSLAAVSRLSQARARLARAEVDYEVAGDRGEFEKAIEELKSWRMARAKGGWCPDGGGAGGSVLKIKEKTKEEGMGTPKMAELGMGRGARPGTAPGKFAADAWAPRIAPAPAPVQQAAPPPDVDREGLETPSSKSDAEGLTPRNIFGPEPGTGDWSKMNDGEIVALLRKKPKLVAFLRTRSSFRRFFRGMGRGRLEGLLREAYSGLGEEECENKVRKRLRLLEGGEEGVVPGGVS